MTPATTPLPDTGLQHAGLRALIEIIDARLPGNLKLLMLAIVRHHNDQSGKCFPSVKRLAAICGKGKRTVQDHLQKLERLGLIQRRAILGYKSLQHDIQFAAVSALEMVKVESVDNFVRASATPADSAPDPRNGCTPPPQISTPTPADIAPQPCKSCALTEKGTETTGGGTVAGAPAQPAEPSPGEPITPPPPVSEDPKTENPVPAAGPAVAIAPDTLAAVNAQRQANGKQPLRRAELQDLGREATLAGIAPQAAAEWILARPGRNFFRADFAAVQPKAPTAAPAPLDDTARAQARAHAEAVQAELVRRSIEAMNTPVPLAIGAATGTGWARAALDRYIRGEDIGHATLTRAAAVEGACLIRLKALRDSSLETAHADLARASVKRLEKMRAYLDGYIAGTEHDADKAARACAGVGRKFADVEAQRAANLAAVAA